jgi:uncharacterized protein
MVFRRRRPLGWLRRLRGLLWPDSGWSRASSYFLHRIKRLPGTPHGIAAGIACGAAISCTPFIGFHFALSFLLCFLVRGNYVAAALGTVVGNPWTFPFIFTWTYQLGRAVLGDTASASLRLADIDSGNFLAEIGQLIWPMTVGSIPTGIAMWFLVYWPSKRVIATFQATRRRRREARRRERLVAQDLHAASLEGQRAD